MPISLSAKKSLRKSLKNRKVNVSFKNKLKDIVKKFVSKPSEEGLKEVYSVLDKAGKNNVYHDNKVSRLKAKYSRTLKNGAPVETKKSAKKANVKKVAKKKTAKKVSKKM
jgi:ribosomal protein S20